jgi:hypothetical protein
VQRAFSETRKPADCRYHLKPFMKLENVFCFVGPETEERQFNAILSTFVGSKSASKTFHGEITARTDANACSIKQPRSRPKHINNFKQMLLKNSWALTT